MHPHERMHALHVLGPRARVLAVEIGVRGAIHGPLAVDESAEVRGELLVGGVAGCPEGVAADGGHGVVV